MKVKHLSPAQNTRIARRYQKQIAAYIHGRFTSYIHSPLMNAARARFLGEMRNKWRMWNFTSMAQLQKKVNDTWTSLMAVCPGEKSTYYEKTRHNEFITLLNEIREYEGEI